MSDKVSLGKYEKNIKLPDAFPVCAICKKPVDRVTWSYNWMTCRHTYMAYCHGQVEISHLTDEEVESADDIRFGIAFTQMKLIG